MPKFQINDISMKYGAMAVMFFFLYNWNRNDFIIRRICLFFKECFVIFQLTAVADKGRDLITKVQLFFVRFFFDRTSIKVWCETKIESWSMFFSPLNVFNLYLAYLHQQCLCYYVTKVYVYCVDLKLQQNCRQKKMCGRFFRELCCGFGLNLKYSQYVWFT